MASIHLDVSQLNTVIAIFGFFIAAFGFISVKLKNHWYLGEARTC
jgi:sodium/hydrogen antiporter